MENARAGLGGRGATGRSRVGRRIPRQDRGGIVDSGSRCVRQFTSERRRGQTRQGASRHRLPAGPDQVDRVISRMNGIEVGSGIRAGVVRVMVETEVDVIDVQSPGFLVNGSRVNMADP